MIIPIITIQLSPFILSNDNGESKGKAAGSSLLLAALHQCWIPAALQPIMNCRARTDACDLSAAAAWPDRKYKAPRKTQCTVRQYQATAPDRLHTGTTTGLRQPLSSLRTERCGQRLPHWVCSSALAATIARRPLMHRITPSEVGLRLLRVGTPHWIHNNRAALASCH